MRLPSSSLLDLWIAAKGDTWARCALRLANAARSRPDGEPVVDLQAASASDEPLAIEPIGCTVSGLLRLRREFAGDALDSTTTCPECGQELQFSLPIARLLSLETDVRSDAGTVCLGGRDVRVRAPGFADLDALAEEPPERRAEALARRCIAGGTPELLDAEAVAAIEAAVEAADPLVEIFVGLTCPECGTRLDAELDIVAHVWGDIEASARALIAEVDALARAYGWSEAEILALDDARRRAYLEYSGALV